MFMPGKTDIKIGVGNPAMVCLIEIGVAPDTEKALVGFRILEKEPEQLPLKKGGKITGLVRHRKKPD
jgi:hypothetical protein